MSEFDIMTFILYNDINDVFFSLKRRLYLSGRNMSNYFVFNIGCCVCYWICCMYMYSFLWAGGRMHPIFPCLSYEATKSVSRWQRICTVRLRQHPVYPQTGC